MWALGPRGRERATVSSFSPPAVRHVPFNPFYLFIYFSYLEPTTKPMGHLIAKNLRGRESEKERERN